jgi:hypothetical protein
LTLLQKNATSVPLAFEIPLFYSERERGGFNTQKFSRSTGSIYLLATPFQGEESVLPFTSSYLGIGDNLFQIAVGCGDDAYVHLSGHLFDDTFVLPLLQHAQEFALQVERNFKVRVPTGSTGTKRLSKMVRLWLQTPTRYTALNPMT